MNKATSSRLSLLAVMLVTLVPLVLAFLMYFQQWWLPSATTNHGQLLMPPQQLEEQYFEYHQEPEFAQQKQAWSVLIHHQGDCTKICQEHLYTLRQVHLALGKEAHRVKRIMLVNNADQLATLAADYPHLYIVSTSKQQMLSEGPGIYVVDPLGNIMMYYSFEQAGKPILKDLKKLLKNSNIG